MFFKNNKYNKYLRNDEETIKACLFGFIIGDALGVPVEFIERNSLKQNPINDMEEYGTHNQPKGTWSDDSSMLLATIDGLLKNSSSCIDYQLIMSNFLQWKLKGEFTPFNQVFDIGISTSDALLKYQQNVLNNHPEDILCGSGDINSNGNGSLMRIIPISLYLHYLGVNYKSENFIDTINCVSSMTHSHSYSVFGCYIYSTYISEILKEQDKCKAYKTLQNILQDVVEGDEKYAGVKEIYNRIIYHDISKLKENDIKSSGYVVDSLEAAIWSVLTTNSFESAVLKAVNLGGDTDTIGAITGGLAGIIYGYNSIPKKWIDVLQKKEYLDNVVASFIKYLKNLNNKDNSKNYEIIKLEGDEMYMNNKIDTQMLIETINDLKNNPEACTTYGENATAGSLALQESKPGEQLSRFIHYFYENNLLDQNYVENYEKIKNKDIKDFTYEEVLTGLSKIIRGDRFISGELYTCVKNGIFLNLVERLYDIIKIGNDKNINNEISDIIKQTKNKYKDVNIQLNDELKKFLNEYNKHVEDIKRLKNDLLNELSQTKNFQKTNDSSVVNDLYNNSVDIENKSVNELINLLMDSCRYNLPKLNIEEELKLNFFINVVKNIELKTSENYVSNFLYSSLYEKLSNEEITKIFNDIKTSEIMNNINETKKNRLASLIYFETLEDAIKAKYEENKKQETVYEVFQKNGKFTIVPTRDWELVGRNGFEVSHIIDKDNFVNAEYNCFANLYYERFGKKAFIANPGGSKKQTIDAIKKSLKENKDLLGDLLNPNEEGSLY